jgi:hypothetical protein
MKPTRPTSAEVLRIARREPDDDPSKAQTAQAINAYYRNAKSGDDAVIRETCSGYLRFHLL